MFINDINDEITRNLNIQDLYNFCHINKYNQSLCQNKQFWINRFMALDLPWHHINNINISHVYEWFVLFDKTKLIMDNYKKVLYGYCELLVYIKNKDLYDLYTKNYHPDPELLITKIYIIKYIGTFRIKSSDGVILLNDFTGRHEFLKYDVFTTLSEKFLQEFMLKLIPYLVN